MKKFKFKFESLLKLKSYNVDLAKNELGKIVAERIKREDEIEKINNEIKALNSIAPKKLDDFKYREDRVRFQKFRINDLNKEIQNILDIENYRRKNLTEALKEEKIYEKLKEKEFENYKYEFKKDENAFIDEVSSRKFHNTI